MMRHLSLSFYAISSRWTKRRSKSLYTHSRSAYLHQVCKSCTTYLSARPLMHNRSYRARTPSRAPVPTIEWEIWAFLLSSRPLRRPGRNIARFLSLLRCQRGRLYLGAQGSLDRTSGVLGADEPQICDTTGGPAGAVIL